LGNKNNRDILKVELIVLSGETNSAIQQTLKHNYHNRDKLTNRNMNKFHPEI
jgi:hypothetical protein